jgi:hypothetical protein
METINTKARTASERLEELTTSPDFEISRLAILGHNGGEEFYLNVQKSSKIYPDGFEAIDRRYGSFLLVENSFGRKVFFYQKSTGEKTPQAPVIE